MILRTVVRDCLYLNWALPLSAVPPAPCPLTYEVHSWQGRDVVFASAQLFRHDHLQLEAVPALRISYPQFNLRLYVTDGEGVPSVLFRCVLVPPWVVPAARLVTRQEVLAGHFRYPPTTTSDDGEGWRWSVRRGASLEVAARPAAPQHGDGPGLGSWEATVSHLWRRPRGYSISPDGLRRIDISHRTVPVWPLRAEIAEAALLDHCLGLVGGGWPALHSAWLCPEIPFVFELGRARENPVPRHVPAPS